MSGAWRWFSTDGSEVPKRVWCEEVGYPNADTEGRVQYRNTHFDTEAEAWESGQTSVDADVWLDTRSVKRLRKHLAEAEAALVQSVLKRDEFNKARAKAESGK